MLGDAGGVAGPLGQRPGAVVQVEGRPVVDQPQAPVPLEQVGVAGRAVDVGDEGVQPYDRGGRAGSTAGGAAGSKASAPGRKSSPGSRRRSPQEVLDLLIGLGRGERRVELDERSRAPRGRRCGRARRRSARRPAPSAPGRAAQLDDVHAVVVGLDQRGERAALAQRRGVACRAHRPERRRGGRALMPARLPRGYGAAGVRAKLRQRGDDEVGLRELVRGVGRRHAHRAGAGRAGGGDPGRGVLHRDATAEARGRAGPPRAGSPRGRACRGARRRRSPAPRAWGGRRRPGAPRPARGRTR